MTTALPLLSRSRRAAGSSSACAFLSFSESGADAVSAFFFPLFPNIRSWHDRNGGPWFCWVHTGQFFPRQLGTYRPEAFLSRAPSAETTAESSFSPRPRLSRRDRLFSPFFHAQERQGLITTSFFFFFWDQINKCAGASALSPFFFFFFPCTEQDTSSSLSLLFLS